jgi:hypothetical protein
MGINPTEQVNASVVMTKSVYERLKRVAAREKRSISKQIAFWVEQRLDTEEPPEQDQEQSNSMQ